MPSQPNPAPPEPRALPQGRCHPSAVRQDSYQRTVLDNGLRVVTDRMPDRQSIALAVLVGASPRDEAADLSGLAHLTEHMFFQGTSTRNARQIAELMDLAGGQFGGFTGRDYTCYTATVLDEHSTYALDLLGDLTLNCTFPLEALAREKEAIVCEIESGRDAPRDRIHGRLMEAVWPDHPLGRPIAGTPRSVRDLTREDVIYFFHRQYVPDRIIIAAAGQVEHEEFVGQVHDAFWRMLGQGSVNRPVPPTPRASTYVESLPVSQVYFSLGIPAYSYTHPGRYGLHVFNSILGGGGSSRLFRRLRVEHGLVYDIDSDYQAYEDAGLLVIEGSTTPDNLLGVLRLIARELASLALGDEPVREEELWKATQQIRRRHLLDTEQTGTRMGRLATQEFYFGRYLPAREILAEIEAIGPADLQSVIHATLGTGFQRATLAVVGPDAERLYPTELLGEILGLAAVQSVGLPL